MNYETFKKLDDLLNRLTAERRDARRISERFTRALQAHDKVETDRWRVELDTAYERIHKLETAVLAV